MPASDQPTPEVADLVRQCVKLLRRYNDQQSTAILRELAPVIVELRSHFELEDGRKDWSGRTYAYRHLMSDVYDQAQVPDSRLDTVQSALRYHVGNLLRERVKREELAAVGMATAAPKERAALAREVLSAQREAVAPEQDVPRLAAYAQALLEYADENAVAELEEERRIASRLALEAVQERAGVLLAAVAEAAGERKPRRRLTSVRSKEAKPH